MDTGKSIKLNGVEILSIRTDYEKHYYTSGVDITSNTYGSRNSYGSAKATYRTSSYKTNCWHFTVHNSNNFTVNNVTLEFTLLDAAGVTLNKQELYFGSLDPHEKMVQTLKPISTCYGIVLKRLAVGGNSINVNHPLATPKMDKVKAISIACLIGLFLFIVLHPHYETSYSYPQIEVIKESSLHIAPNGNAVKLIKPGSFLRLVDKQSGPTINSNGATLKWYKVITGYDGSARWVRSDAVKVSANTKPITYRRLKWGW